MTLQTDIEYLRYDESVNLPKFKKALERLIERKQFHYCLSTETVPDDELLSFVEKAISEGNSLIIEKCYNGRFITLWKDR